MRDPHPYGGVVVPLVTPATPAGQPDLDALARLVEFQSAAGVEGLLLLGTTGEGPSVPRRWRPDLLRQAVAAARGRLRLCVNLQENALADALAAAGESFALGAEAVCLLPPSYFPPRPPELAAWFRAFLDASPGPVLLYNLPSTTRVSLPLEVIGALVGHPRLAGLKDSENDPTRHAELRRRFGGRRDFALLCGVGALMAQGVAAGMHGIVPSVGNLVPEACRGLVAAARRGDASGVARHSRRMAAVAALYQEGRSLGESLAAIKALLHLRGLCSPAVFPPLLACLPAEIEALRGLAATVLPT